jgi:thymidine kinase
MAKLYFRYGTVGSAKTLNLLAVAHNYRQQGKQVVIIKPRLDNRFGEDFVKSRAGLESRADLVVDPDTSLDRMLLRGVHCVLVDEAQFISPGLIEQLRDIATNDNIPVICYGLRTDFRTNLFEGARRLLELSDSIEEIKTTCSYCQRKATLNLKHVGGVASLDGPTIDLGAEEKYYSVCHGCYESQIAMALRDNSWGEKKVSNL